MRLATRPIVRIPAPSERVGHPASHVLLDAIQRHRREEGPVGQMRESFGLTADANETLDPIVPGREVGVPNGPVDGDPVSLVGLEVEVAPAIDLPGPDYGLAPDLSRAKPEERSIGGRAVWVLDVIGPKNVTELIE